SNFVALPRQYTQQYAHNMHYSYIYLSSPSQESNYGYITSPSQPSRPIISRIMAICSSPRPTTRKTSVSELVSTRRLTFFSNSFSRRSLRCREVTYLPSLPAKGEVFAV